MDTFRITPKGELQLEVVVPTSLGFKKNIFVLAVKKVEPYTSIFQKLYDHSQWRVVS